MRVNITTVLKIILTTLVGLIFILLFVYWRNSIAPVDAVAPTKEFAHILSIYAYGPGPTEQLKRPSDAAFDRDGNVYIADSGHARVLVFNRKGKFLRQIGRKGIKAGELRVPLGLAVDNSGRVYVADQALNKVVVYGPDGRFKREFRVMFPLKPVVFSDKLYLINYAGVLIYDLEDGKELGRWGRRGSGRGEFKNPVGLAVDRKGAVYAADSLNNRVQAFDLFGEVAWVAGGPIKGGVLAERRFGLPAGLTVDGDGRLYLVDAFNHQIEVLDASNGKHLAFVGDEGDKEGRFFYPQGIAYWDNNIFAVADKYNNRVQLVRISVD